MVISQSPSKFYGSSLPRPRIYTAMKLNEARVDPPVSVVDPLLSWAQEAHWSMGGLSFHRHRLQGRIEGNVQKLRSQRESEIKKMGEIEKNGKFSTPVDSPAESKRRWRVVDEEEEEEMEEKVVERVNRRRRLVKGLKGMVVVEEVVVGFRKSAMVEKSLMS